MKIKTMRKKIDFEKKIKMHIFVVFSPLWAPPDNDKEPLNTNIQLSPKLPQPSSFRFGT